MRANKGLDQILSNSAKLMARAGYDGTSMRDLARETGRSLSGLYHYFKNKEELLYLINMAGFSSLLEEALQIEKADLSPDQRLFALISNHVRYFDAHPYEMKVMLLGTQAMDSKRAKKVREVKSQYAATAKRIVSEALASSSRRPKGKAEIARRTFLLFGMMNWIQGWYSPAEHGSTEDLIEDIYHVFTSGILKERRNGFGIDRTKM